MCKGQAAVKVCGRIASGRLIIASQSEPSIGAQEDDSDPASMQRAVAIALEAKPTDDSSEVRASVIFGLGRMSSLVASGQLSQEAARQYLDDTHKELEHFANPAKVWLLTQCLLCSSCLLGSMQAVFEIASCCCDCNGVVGHLQLIVSQMQQHHICCDLHPVHN